jgi:hypothetical protein
MVMKDTANLLFNKCEYFPMLGVKEKIPSFFSTHMMTRAIDPKLQSYQKIKCIERFSKVIPKQKIAQHLDND